jgi:hypothetical protein
MYSFLTVNNFIEHNFQKGFTPNMSGTLEHTAQMANIINKARIKQRSLVITPGPFLTYKLVGANATQPPLVPPPTKSHFPPQEKSLFPKIIQTNQRRIYSK